ncbi:hypothetical protein KUL25_02465 [Rhodobacteraceae bacterium N5(2021)]|uniref:HPr kinase/phosphorylase C-terminal domain-containing protein n=1 Tax=Gymnodinialimonas phycosphaerae TaxID=2841589 RepID=A0A975TVU2_9RHOB|nr:hypothetical protein [Gymnodinialimonas phycosphaerae]MBY4891625.1 hypothetical protein [Gymnodinialimonas phycosphaerae]
MQSASVTSFAYRAYGFNLVSDIPLARLSPGIDLGLDTITVTRQEVMPEAPANAAKIGPYLRAAPGFLSLDIDGVVRMAAIAGQRLLYCPYDGTDDASVQVFLMGSGLGAVLMQRKLLVMHGNAVEVAGACVMCVGPSGVGKSTTAAGLMQRGHRVMSDDVCAINGAGQIVPGIPSIKLWQSAADGLGMATKGLDPVRPDMEKYGLPLGRAFYADPLPVTRIYVLSPNGSATVSLERLNAAEKFDTLRDNTYRFPFVAALGLSTLHFQQLADLARRISVTRIKRPAEGFHLDQLLDALIADTTDQVRNT